MTRLRASAQVSNSALMQRLAAHLDGLSDRQLQTVVSRAAVGVRRKATVMAKRDVRSEYAVQASALSNAFGARNDTDARGAFVALTATVAPTSLIRFGARWSRRAAGATAEIKRGQRKTYTAAFIPTLKNGQKQVMARKLLADGQRTPRLPLVKLTGPSAYQMVQGRDGSAAGRISAALAEFASDEIRRQLLLVRKGKSRS